MSVEEQVRKHFDADAFRFDAIYHEKKNLVRRFVDDVWRGVVRKRFHLVMQRLGSLEGKTILDVGCGSGRYCLAYAAAGAKNVVGIDFAAAMIEIANRYAAEQKISDRCHFIAGTFPGDVPAGTYDYSTAMGFFDYVADAAALVRAMRDRTRSMMIMSFPKSREFRVPLRRLRFWLARCPLFLYSRSRVEQVLAAAGVREYEIVELDRDYVVIAKGTP